MAEYLERILKAQVYDLAIETSLDPAPRLSARLGNQILLKREDMQPVFSFKLRGACNKLAQLTPAERAAGMICSSAGNHGQGVALAGRALGVRSVIVMPTTTPTIRARRCVRWAVKSYCTGSPMTMPTRVPGNLLRLKA